MRAILAGRILFSTIDSIRVNSRGLKERYKHNAAGARVLGASGSREISYFSCQRRSAIESPDSFDAAEQTESIREGLPVSAKKKTPKCGLRRANV